MNGGEEAGRDENLQENPRNPRNPRIPRDVAADRWEEEL